MNTLRKRRFALKVVYSSLFSAGMLVLPGTAGAAIPIPGSVNFCAAYKGYDNALVPVPGQSTGRFTDLRRGNDINAHHFAAPPNDYCQLNLTGSTGSAGDMWITMLDSPDGAEGPAPTFFCPGVKAEVLIKRFDNRKAVGFVTHYDPATGKGLFLGLYDNGNTDALTLSTFNATTGQLTGTVATKALGSKIQENVWYTLSLDVCVEPDNGVIHGNALVEGGLNNISEGMTFGPVANTAGISHSGQIGIAGQAKSSFVDSSVRNFNWDELD
jgi:hypothetical protein